MVVMPVANSVPAAMSIEALSAELLDLVSNRTGYPKEMLDLDLDLEADLGIDSIKRVEILGTLAEGLSETESDVESKIVLTVAPTVGDLGEVTYDVIGLADDALFGVRLHVFGQPTDSGEGFSLMSVEQTALCGRGTNEAGLCL